MKKIFFTVGPTQLYPTVHSHIQSALREDVLSISHRGAKFHEIYFNTTQKLKKLLSIPNDYHIFFISSGTEAMERIIQNCVGKISFHVITGAFATRFFSIAEELGKKPIAYKVPFGDGVSFDTLNIPKSAEALCITHNDTSTGVALPLELAKIKKKNPNLLVAVDTVSSLPYADLDYSLLDVVFFSVQKGFGQPSGMGVLIVSPQAIKKAERLSKSISIGSYHNFLHLVNYTQKHETPETPNVLGMYLLEKVLDDFLSIGIKKIRHETEEKAALLYDFFDASDEYLPFVKEKVFRSQTTLVIEVKGGSKELIEKLKKKEIIVSSGYGKYKEKHIRIADFPSHTKEDVERLIDSLLA